MKRVEICREAWTDPARVHRATDETSVAMTWRRRGEVPTIQVPMARASLLSDARWATFCTRVAVNREMQLAAG